MGEPQAYPSAIASETAGTMAVVVGPSGAGKDTLMAVAARHFEGRADVHFTRRVITRDADAGGESHRAVSENDFDAMLHNGEFAVHWDAHGLKYGIPAGVFDELGRGNLVIANGSRSVLDRFKAAFPRLVVISITARPEVLAERLQSRGRETREDILKRLERSSLTIDGDYHVVIIDNSDALEEAGQQIVEVLEGLLGDKG